MSEYDLSILQQLSLPMDLMVLIPNGTDKLPAKPPQYDDRTKNGIIFVGNLHYPPNMRAVEFIRDKIAPKIGKIEPDMKFHICGDFEPGVFGKTPSNMKFYGFTDDLSAIANKCFTGIAPIFHGSGMKIKPLTITSLGLPLIASQEARRGYLEPDPFIKSETPKQFIESLVRIKNDRREAHLLAQKAHQYIKENYDWSILIEKLVSTYKKVIDDRADHDWQKEYSGSIGEDLEFIQDAEIPQWLSESRVIGTTKPISEQSLRWVRK